MYVQHCRYVHFSSRMNRLGTASGASAFHWHLFYSSSEHLEHPPPHPTQVAVAFANADRCLEDHGRACGQGSDAGREGGSGVGHCSRGHGRWLWQAGSAWRNDRHRPPDTRQWMGVRGSKRQRASARGWRLLWQSQAGAQEWAMGQVEPRAVAAGWAARRGEQLRLGQRLQGQPGAGAQTRAATQWHQAGYRARISQELAGGGGEGQTAGTAGSNNQATGRRRHMAWHRNG